MSKRDLDDFVGRPLYFKHVYTRAVSESGVVGFPKTQSARTAAKRYERGGGVLLAVPLDPEPIGGEMAPEDVRGRIFGVCTLVNIQGAPTRDIANPEMVRRAPEVAERWPTALPVLKLWHFEQPRTYAEFADGLLAQLGGEQRGHLIPIKASALDAELRAWLSEAPRTEQPIFHSPRVRAHLARFEGP